jgi:hypothetical protein
MYITNILKKQPYRIKYEILCCLSIRMYGQTNSGKQIILLIEGNYDAMGYEIKAMQV